MIPESTASRRGLALALVGLLGGCAGKTITPPASFPAKTTLPLAPPRCSPAGCSCRELGDNAAEEQIPAGHKRFEWRLPKTTSAIWVSIDGRGVFYKPPELLQPVCFLLDLPPGEHAVTLQSEMTDVQVGLQTGLDIYEYGPQEGPFWYRSLDFICGGLNVCTRQAVEAWIAGHRQRPRGVVDPCGSVMLKRVSSSGSVDQRLDLQYRDLTLRFVLKVYAFATHLPPGSPECRAPVKNR